VKPRFQADKDLRSAIRRGTIRREPSIDFQSALELDLDGIPDPEVLCLCAEQGRILVSHDEGSMPQHFREFVLSGNQSPGVLLVAQWTPIAVVIENLVLLWSASSADEWHDRIVWLPL
jgi:hypothetical protein